MMIINNIDAIAGILEFQNPDDFYWMQIIRRGKDHPELPATNLSIHSYYIRSIKDYNKYSPMAIKMAEAFGARAYFYPQRKNYKNVMLHQLSEIAQRIYNNNTISGHRTFNHCAAVTSEESIWIIDLDDKDPVLLKEVEMYICHDCRPSGTHKLIKTIPTLNGYHIMCRRFDRREFNERFPDVEIKPNGPVLLYANDITFNKTK